MTHSYLIMVGPAWVEEQSVIVVLRAGVGRENIYPGVLWYSRRRPWHGTRSTGCWKRRARVHTKTRERGPLPAVWKQRASAGWVEDVVPCKSEALVRSGVCWRGINEVLPGFEPGSLDSESRVLTITP